VKVTSEHFKCDLCGRFSNLGVTESYNVDGGDVEMRCENTVCARCIGTAIHLFVDGLVEVAEPNGT
jgi:hypothetical protein